MALAARASERRPPEVGAAAAIKPQFDSNPEPKPEQLFRPPILERPPREPKPIDPMGTDRSFTEDASTR